MTIATSQKRISSFFQNLLKTFKSFKSSDGLQLLILTGTAIMIGRTLVDIIGSITLAISVNALYFIYKEYKAKAKPTNKDRSEYLKVNIMLTAMFISTALTLYQS